VPGDYPFYFNEIQSTSDIMEGRYGDHFEKLSMAFLQLLSTPLVALLYVPSV
jgi:hypothetical protein